MSTTYTASVRTIVGLLPGPAAQERIHRIDVRKDGSLDVTLDGAPGPAWFRYDGERLRPLRPGEDERVPLARHLAKHRDTYEVLAWRPGRRLVLGARSGAGPVLKGHRKRRGAEALRRHRVARGATGPEAFVVPEASEHSDVPDCMVLERLAGESLPIRDDQADLHRAVGAGLRRLQQVPSQGLPDFGVGEELEVLTRWSTRVAGAGVPRAAEWARVHDRLLAAAEHLPPPRFATAHRDLHDRQLLVTPGGLALFDFDLLCRADVALDAANLSAHYALRLLQDRSASAAVTETVCSEALLDGLGREGEDEGFRARLSFYTATTFLRLALVYALRPRWAHLGDELTARAERSIERLGRS